MPSTAKTFCRNCQANCGLELTVEGNHIVSMKGDRNHALTRGYFCVKGSMSVQLLGGAEGRLLSSKRRTPQGDYIDVDGDTALDEIAVRLSKIIDTHGPGAVAVYQGTGGYLNTLGYALMKSFVSALKTPNFFTTMTIDQSAKWVALCRIGMMLSGKRTLLESDTILLAGSNPALSHQGYPFSPIISSNPLKHLDAFRKRGGRLIVVDPRRTETARRADLHLQIYPGEDATLFAGLLNLIFMGGFSDEAFCARFVTHLDVLRKAVSVYDLDYVSSRTRIPTEELLLAARMYGAGSRRAAASGTGANMGAHSNLSEHLIEVLNTVCGGYRKAGDIVPNPGSLFPQRFVETALPPNRTWESGPKCRTSNTGRLLGEFPSALLPQEIMAPGEGRIRALIVFAGNPAMAICDPETTVAALKDLDLLVTVDPRMTETGGLAHYVIAPSLQYERHDLTSIADATHSERFVQYAAPVVEKPAGTMHDWEFFWGLGSRMGYRLSFKHPIIGQDYASIPNGLDLDMQRKPSPESLIRHLCEQGGVVSFDDLKANPGGLSINGPAVVVQTTPSDNGARLDVCPADVAEELRQLRAEQGSARFKYRLATRRLLESLNSAFRDAAPTRSRYPTNAAYMNPTDMQLEGFVDGDAIVIRSEHGEIVGLARADPSIKEGVVSMAHLWGSLEPSSDPSGRTGGHTGRLVSLIGPVETINHMPRQTGIPINVRKYEGESPVP
jgi:anaerobic selenocysteine-containing dehydrogenase